MKLLRLPDIPLGVKGKETCQGCKFLKCSGSVDLDDKRLYTIENRCLIFEPLGVEMPSISVPYTGFGSEKGLILPFEGPWPSVRLPQCIYAEVGKPEEPKKTCWNWLLEEPEI